MANSCQLQPVLCFLLPAMLIISGANLKPVNGQITNQGSYSWCIVRPSASEDALIGNINFACEEVDCSIIQPGGDCFYPATLVNHASVVMNLYYQKLGKHHWNCDFKKTGILAVTDPSRLWRLQISIWLLGWSLLVLSIF